MHKAILAGGSLLILAGVLIFSVTKQDSSGQPFSTHEETKAVASSSDSEGDRNLPVPDPARVSGSEKMKIQVFYYTAGDVSDDSSFSKFDRLVDKSPAVADAALRSLFNGPTETEIAAGVNRSTAPKLDNGYLDVSINDGVAYVNLTQEAFDAIFSGAPGENAPTSGSIKRTLLQFDTIKDVRYRIDGQSAQFDA